MNELHLADRQAKAEKIINQPTGFKVCEGCSSIVVSVEVHCSICHSYRFDDSVDVVKRTAAELASRPQQSVTEEDLYN